MNGKIYNLLPGYLGVGLNLDQKWSVSSDVSSINWHCKFGRA